MTLLEIVAPSTQTKAYHEPLGVWRKVLNHTLHAAAKWAFDLSGGQNDVQDKSKIQVTDLKRSFFFKIWTLTSCFNNSTDNSKKEPTANKYKK